MLVRSAEDEKQICRGWPEYKSKQARAGELGNLASLPWHSKSTSKALHLSEEDVAQWLGRHKGRPWSSQYLQLTGGRMPGKGFSARPREALQVRTDNRGQFSQ